MTAFSNGSVAHLWTSTRIDFAGAVLAAMAAIERSIQLINELRPRLVVISHPFDFTYGSLAWVALSQGIEVVLVYGLFGVLRFSRLRSPEDLFCFYDRPSAADLAQLNPGQADRLAAAGRDYLAARLAGQADDLASTYAFRAPTDVADRPAICAQFGWDPSKTIVAFYASNWFDWPHQLGMSQFRDFLDWTEATFAAAAANDQVNWLFKPHPAEDWFGAVSLADILARNARPGHIAIADKAWNSAQVMRAVDALVTYHGTAGVEFAALGKPVLVPDRGKYDDCGFVQLARSRRHYLALLGQSWWQDQNLKQAKSRAEIFAGWWFCAPQWQGDFLLADDALQDALYNSIGPMLRKNAPSVVREIAELTSWWQSGHRYYHTYKMGHAAEFALTNVRAKAPAAR